MTVNLLLGTFTFFIEIKQHRQVIQLFSDVNVNICPAFQEGYFFQLFLCFPGIIPEILGLGLIFFFPDQGKFPVDVKDTSPGRRCALLTL
jgi:hypothetical protein